MHFLHFVNPVYKESSFSPHANCKGQLHTVLAPSSSRSCQTWVSSPLQGLPSVNLHNLLSIPLQCVFSVLLIYTDFFLSVLLFTSFAKEVNQCQSRYVSDPCGSLPLADSVVLWFCGSVMWQTILFTFTLCTKNYTDLGTSGNVWEILANLKPKLKDFHQVSEKCSGSSYLDFALILLLRFLYVWTNILADYIY